MRILKFGGSSLGSSQEIREMISIVKTYQEPSLLIVVSALRGITDKLIATSKLAETGNETYLQQLQAIEELHLTIARELTDVRQQSAVLARIKCELNALGDILHGLYLIRELTPKTLDFILGFGEKLSAYIVSCAFEARKLPIKAAEAGELIVTDRTFGKGSVNFELTNRNIGQKIKGEEGGIWIVPGFIGSTEGGEAVTLGRGGSDYTAAIFAAALQADVLEKWTNVDGLMTADPLSVPKAFVIEDITYEEAMELSYFGAKVVYPPSLQPLLEKKIPFRIRNVARPEAKGTLISKVTANGQKPVKGISSIRNIALLNISGSGMVGVSGVSKRLFAALAEEKINVILISQASSEHSISLAVEQPYAAAAKRAVEQEFVHELGQQQIERVEQKEKMAIIAVVGKHMNSTPGMAGTLFHSLGREGVNIYTIAQGASEINISFIVREQDERKALNIIHDAFFLSDKKVLHLFLAGTGQIGKSLLSQLQEQLPVLEEENSLEIKLMGMTNTRKMLIGDKPIALIQWQELLQESRRESHLPAFVEEMISLNLPHSLFIDCTASPEVAGVYDKVMDASISVVTANKLACAGSWDYYRKIKEMVRKRGIRFYYETNVGAGLPVINTLIDLVKSGDKVQTIEAILSGSLNYIFNTFSREVPFSEAVKEAQQKGYTEPDPTIDLSGKDVANKILILARELGYAFSLEDVQVQSFLPEAILQEKCPEAFWQKLQGQDAEMEAIRSREQEAGKKLRVYAKLEDNRLSVQLGAFDRSHSFFAAESSDNIIQFTTYRYRQQPLIIKGPGAGAEVTAAGVFADIIRVAN